MAGDDRRLLGRAVGYRARMFDGPDLRVVAEVVGNRAIEHAQRLTDDVLLASEADKLVEDILEGLDMDTPVLHLDEWSISAGQSGEALELHVPFTGTSGLFGNQPNFYTSNPPEGRVQGSEVIVPVGPADYGVDDRAGRWAANVQQYLDAVAHDLDIWRQQLRGQLHRLITTRKQRAESHQAGIRAIGIPIRPRERAPTTFREPAIVRREPRSRVVAGDSSIDQPEPVLSDDYYEHILFVIRAAGKAMERAPETYAGWGEEARRQVLILMLNTHYAGKVLAEAFNGDGKTDILIREEDKNVFIGECKFYRGPANVTETLAQIFGYATWRDVKLAIIFFVDRESFTDAVERIRETVGHNEQFDSWMTVSDADETEFRARMIWPGDERRFVTMHVSCFHTPRPAS